jgi:hypothetical protein
MLEVNSLLTEDLPVSSALVTLCQLGEQALSYAKGGAPADWKQSALAMLRDANGHHASLSIAIAPGVQKLVDAAR